MTISAILVCRRAAVSAFSTTGLPLFSREGIDPTCLTSKTPSAPLVPDSAQSQHSHSTVPPIAAPNSEATACVSNGSIDLSRAANRAREGKRTGGKEERGKGKLGKRGEREGEAGRPHDSPLLD